MKDSPSILKVSQLGRRIEDRWLWRGISFEVHPGDRLGVMGPSGIGKSLLMRALVGLDPLDSGEVIFQGRSLDQWDKPKLRQKMIYLAQSPGLLEGSVEENLRAVFRLKVNRDRQYSQERVLELFKRVNRGESFLGQSSDRLSGGERQLLNLVRALQLNPQVLLLDEPTAALDQEAIAQVESLLTHWWQEESAPEKRAYLWISHSPEQIDRMTHLQLHLSEFAP